MERADANKEHMGLTTWENAPDGKILKTDVMVAKNYLSEQEMHYLEAHRLSLSGLCGIAGGAQDSHEHGRLGEASGWLFGV